jgi:hypothetical protein
MNTKPNLSIIIVTWNNKEDITPCIKSIEKQCCFAEVIVVDNASTDGTCEAIKMDFPWIKLIELSENLGFPKANNIGINISRGEYILLLNPDTIIPGGNLNTMYELMENHRDIGVSTCIIKYPTGRIQFEAGRRFYSLIDFLFTAIYLNVLFPNTCLNYQLIGNWDHKSSRSVDCISGAYMFIRKNVLEQIGILDETFFMYFEDVDLCYRVRQAEWKIWYESSTYIIHSGGSSRKKSKIDFSNNRVDVPYFFFVKHYGKNKNLFFKYVFIFHIVTRLAIALILYLPGYFLHNLRETTNLFNYKLYKKMLIYAFKVYTKNPPTRIYKLDKNSS